MFMYIKYIVLYVNTKRLYNQHFTTKNLSRRRKE